MSLLQFSLTLLVLVSVGSIGSGATVNGYGSSTRTRPMPENGNNVSPNRNQNTGQNVPSVDNVSYEELVQMPAAKASSMLRAVAQQSNSRQNTEPLFTPSAEDIKMYMITSTGNFSVPLNMPTMFNNYPQLSTGEVTIFITGVPSNSENPSDAISQLIEAYRTRYQMNDNQRPYTNSWDAPTTGSLIVIDLGNSFENFQNWAKLDIESTGKVIAHALVTMSEFVPYYNIHLIGHSVGAHVAGAAARHFTQEKDVQLRRVTGLDPSKLFTRDQQVHSKLNRGVADFVDAIHTTSYGAGSESNGDADFYPNGPGSIAPGSENIIEASEKAIRYFAETVRPGGERNFMAVECNSMKNYENHHCHGIRVPMGYNTPFDVKGNFVLKVNSMAPYGTNAHSNIRNQRMRSPSH